MLRAPREELLFSQAVIRAGLLSIEQYQEVLELCSKLRESGEGTPLDQVILQKGYLSREVVDKIRSEVGYPSTHGDDKENEVFLEVQSLLEDPPSPPGYSLDKKLGEGGMGTVFKAHDTESNATVAIKFLDPRYKKDSESFRRFQREAVATQKLEHPNIVRSLTSGESKGVSYLVMEYVDGTPLSLVLENGAMEEERVVKLILQTANALQYAHENGFVHRDIKPDNILLNKEDEIKICDFGLARAMEGGNTLMTKVGSFMGTPQYVSPEQARGLEDIDCRADIYSLGCTFYHMLTGEPPYPGNNPLTVVTYQATKLFPDPSVIKPNLSSQVVSTLRKMTAKDRSLRLASMDDVVKNLTEDPAARQAKINPMLKRTSRITKSMPSSRRSSRMERHTRRRSVRSDLSSGILKTERKIDTLKKYNGKDHKIILSLLIGSIALAVIIGVLFFM